MSKRALFLLAIVAAPASAQPSLTVRQMQGLDSLFADRTSLERPGCALGISKNDTLIHSRSWGSADLEHSVRMMPTTIFEAGSVSKQFTAAAVLLLAQRGKLSLDSSVRKYVPELAEYTAPITIRHLIHHTSGLRDWGTVMAFAGWPRGTRTYTNAHVLEILARQKALNYPVGSEFLYSNSNYNLLAIIAERVSGRSLPDLTRTEFFEPLGMTNTGWRDDYAKIVKGRAQAYSGSGNTLRLTMPFENVYGNSSLLTTVSDLLKWNANLATKRIGGDEFVAMQLKQGKLNNGRSITYAGGMYVRTFDGAAEIAHDGATAGYRAFLARYPDAGYSVALLCNDGEVDPTGMGRSVARVLIPDLKAAAPPPFDSAGVTVPANRLTRFAGYYRQSRTDDPLALVVENGRLRIVGGAVLTAVDERHFIARRGPTHLMFEIPGGEPRPRLKTWTENGDTSTYVAVGAPRPGSSFEDYAGDFYSEEADARMSFVLDKGEVVLVQRPGTRFALRPLYEDGFAGRGTVVRFTRKNGKVDGFLVTGARARGVRFDRVR